MKKTLLTLMLVSSLFVISCGADATKPQDAYKSQTTETVTGTRTKSFTATTGTVDITTSYGLSVGEKVTEIVQVTTTSTTGTKTTNTVSAITKNADGGIYQFTISDASAVNATVTYKYSKKEAAPTVIKEAAGTYAGSSTSPLTINDVNFTDEEKSFDKNVVSVTDKYNVQLKDTDYTYNNYTVTIKKTGYYQGDAFTVRYTYRDISMISEKPLTGNVTITDAASGVGTATVTIPLDAALHAGRSYYLKAVITDTPTGSGVTPTTETIYYNKIVPSTGIIYITLTTITQPSFQTTSGTYELWVY